MLAGNRVSVGWTKRDGLPKHAKQMLTKQHGPRPSQVLTTRSLNQIGLFPPERVF